MVQFQNSAQLPFQSAVYGGLRERYRKEKGDCYRVLFTTDAWISIRMTPEALDALQMTFFTAMLPVLELRGAIPLGIAAGLPVPLVVSAAIAGNLLPIPFILLLIRHIFHWLRKIPKIGHLIDRMEQRAHVKGRTVKKYRTFGLVLLVAIPLPGTGAWTGALVADVLDIRMRTALPAIALGVLIAAILMTAMTLGVITIF